jgi:hypothetical protein
LVESCGGVMKLKKRIISYLERKWWYLVLLILSTIYILYYKNDINQLKEFNTVNLIFIIWLVLLLLPLFSEMEFFGIRLKKEVEQAKTEVKENLNDIRMQIMDLKFSNSNTNTINFGNGILPTEQKLKELIKEFITNSDAAGDNLIELKSKSEFDKSSYAEYPNSTDLDISEDSTYLFKIRLILEKTLTDLCVKTNYNGSKSIFEMMRHLNRCQVIDSKTADLISQIIIIANRGVHGEIISKEYIYFIKQVFPELQKQLYGIKSQLS